MGRSHQAFGGRGRRLLHTSLCEECSAYSSVMLAGRRWDDEGVVFFLCHFPWLLLKALKGSSLQTRHSGSWTWGGAVPVEVFYRYPWKPSGEGAAFTQGAFAHWHPGAPKKRNG